MMSFGAISGFGGGQMPNMSQMRERMFQKADANGDKGISLEEFQNAGKNLPGGMNRTSDQAAEAFGKIDTNRDGSLDQNEMTAFGDRMSDEMRSAMVAMQAMMGGAGGLGGQGGSLDSLLSGNRAYGSGSNQSSDLTQSLLQALDSGDERDERVDRRA